MGMWTDINNIHTLYEDNVVVHNDDGWHQPRDQLQAIIRNNTLFGNGADDRAVGGGEMKSIFKTPRTWRSMATGSR